MKIKDEIMAKVIEKEKRDRCLKVRICPECGSDLITDTYSYLKCPIPLCSFNAPK